MKILIIGTSGFVGSHLLESLGEDLEIVETSERLGLKTDWRPVLEGCRCVIIAAGVAQAKNRGGQYSRALHELNFEGINKLVDDVAESSVEVVVNVSSVAASGIMTSQTAITEETAEYRDESPYGKSKRQGEEAILRLEDLGKVGISLRTPLIYGRRAKGNWPKLVKLSRIPAPLPFRSVCNNRSFLGIHNLADFLDFTLKLDTEMLESGVFNISDGDPVSFSDVISALRESREKPPLLFSFPRTILRVPVEVVMGQKAAAGIFSDLVLDTSKLEKNFTWRPKLGTLESLRRGYGE